MVSLVKGQKVDLTKGNAGLKKILVGLGWDTNKYDGDDFDLDASAFLLDKNGKVTTDKDFVFFNNLVHPSGAVKHMGDNLTGSGDGDDEQIIVDLAKHRVLDILPGRNQQCLTQYFYSFPKIPI